MQPPPTDAGTESAIDAVVATVIAEMSAHLVEESRNIRAVLEREIAELGGDTQLVELLGASIEGNVDTVFHVLQHGITTDHLHAPSAAMEYARRLAQHAIPVTALVRAYRLGQSTLLDRIFARIQASPIDPALGLQVSHRIVSVSSVYIDWISEQVVSAYQVEHERWLANRNNVRATQIRELLSTGGPTDDRLATKQIGYQLAQHHCAAILWTGEPESERDGLSLLEQLAGRICQSIDNRPTPLFVAADTLSAWVWIPLGNRPDRLDVSNIRASLGADDFGDAQVALGTVQVGSAGFRTSHLQAQHARSIAALAEGARRTVTSYADPGVAVSSLVGSDLPRAHEWIRTTLGPLADNTEAAQRLRDTLRTYFDCRSSHKATALALHLHYNTVKYRVKSAEQMLGHPINENRFDIEQALMLQSWLGSAPAQTQS
ncbi:helix-turn-helix domain-containing protein [Rhodococcus sp. IEGM 1381]|uniref:PucR family transcriptional regulator n=1 Tax=Rhodococcus sp. IEGM 1381 TaxID=3047085 RepID=UPI0024B799A6|nr:helix-turn-helix domain-containing protein [Rhodococcus sp. IEGM 1381]MDI9894177.1 helix-turn-helix domain-containing protein [Rhodococcus sp. IEGM 1381]